MILKKLAEHDRESAVQKAVEEALTNLEVAKNKIIEMKYHLEESNLNFGYAINSNNEIKIKEEKENVKAAKQQLKQALVERKDLVDAFFSQYPNEAEEEKEMWPELFEENESLEREREKIIEDALEKNKQENEKLRVLTEKISIMEREISEDIKIPDTSSSSTSTGTYDLIDGFLESIDYVTLLSGTAEAEEEQEETSPPATAEGETAIDIKTIAKIKTVFRGSLNKAREVLRIKQNEENEKLLALEVQDLSDLKKKYDDIAYYSSGGRSLLRKDQCEQYVRENRGGITEDGYTIELMKQFREVKGEVKEFYIDRPHPDPENYIRSISIIAEEELAFIEINERSKIVGKERSEVNFIDNSKVNEMLFKLVLRFYCSEKYILANKYKGENAGLRGNGEFLDAYSEFDSFFPDKNVFFSYH